MRRLTLNIDMDGVIYDFNGMMTSLGETYLKRDLPVTDGWEMWDAWGVSRDEWYEMFNDAIIDGVFAYGAEIEGAVAAVRRLAKEHRIRIVTAKKLRYLDSTLRAQKDTLNWLARSDLLNLVEVVFTSNKQGYPADVVIDDKPTLEWAQSGSLNLLFRQPWNDSVPEEAFHKEPLITEVHTWDEVEVQVRDLANWTEPTPLHEIGRYGG